MEGKKENHLPTEREVTARPNVPEPTAASVGKASVPQGALPQDGAQRLTASSRRRRGPTRL